MIARQCKQKKELLKQSSATLFCILMLNPSSLCLVAEDEEGIQGWCKISKVSDRCVYEGVGEVSVYVRDVSRGKGVGKQLLQAVIKESEAKGFWTLTAGIFPENIPSLRLHQSVGFRKVGIRQRKS
jgi:phosphinothricin acetyltransferase